MLADVEAALAARPPDSTLVLLFDFDGTLAEFDLDPAAPVLTQERREWLTAVADRSRRHARRRQRPAAG